MRECWEHLLGASTSRELKASDLCTFEGVGYAVEQLLGSLYVGLLKQKRFGSQITGDRFFLMPDPRKLHFHADTYIGFNGGPSRAVDEYGRRPNSKDRDILAFRNNEQEIFRKHQKLWESKFGKLTPAQLRAIWFGGEVPLEDT